MPKKVLRSLYRSTHRELDIKRYLVYDIGSKDRCGGTPAPLPTSQEKVGKIQTLVASSFSNATKPAKVGVRKHVRPWGDPTQETPEAPFGT